MTAQTRMCYHTPMTDNDSHSYIKTPQEAEADKSSQERAEDISYTLNHAIACTITDMAEMGFDYYVRKKAFDKDVNMFHIIVGEMSGDFLAVPLTVAMQRYFPGFMQQLAKGTELFLGPLFRIGANNTAKSWAKREGIAIESNEYHQKVQRKADEIYQYEVSHLGQALMWTTSSIAINMGTQKILDPKVPLSEMLAGKAAGAALSAGVLLAVRSLAPKTAHRWDQAVSKHVLLPVSKAINKALGIKNPSEEHPPKPQNTSGKEWTKRLEDLPPDNSPKRGM